MIRSFKLVRHVGVIPAVVFGAVLLGGGGAQAQQARQMVFSSMGGGDGGMFRPPVTPRDLDRYAKVLGLNDEQKASAKELVDSVSSEFNAVSKETREKMDEINAEFSDSHDPSVFREQMPAVMKKFSEKQKSITDGFLGDLKLLLNPEQEARWSRFEMLRRRERSGGFGSLAGESVDLVKVSEKIGVVSDPNFTGAPEQVKAVLEQYEVDLDKAIQDRMKAMEARGSIGRPGDGAPPDPEKLQQTLSEIREKSKAVRDVNQRYARQLASALGEPTATKLADEVKRQSYPQVYKESYTGKALGTALSMPDLTADQKAALQSLKDSYDREAVAAQDKWASAVQEADSAGESGGVMSGGSGGATFIRMGDEPEAIKSARKAKRELDDKALEKINSTLTESQRSKLPPKRTPQSSRPMDHGGDEGEGDVMEIQIVQ